MTSNRTCFKVKLCFSGGMLSRAAGGIRFGLDQAMLRESWSNAPALPGSLIKGNLRHAWRALAQAGHDKIGRHLNQLLGPPAIPDEPAPEHTEKDAPRGALLFDDLWLAEGDTQETIRHRIRIDETTGAVKKGALLMSEQIEPPQGQPLCFTGQIELDGPLHGEKAIELEPETVKNWIANGLAYAQALGAHKGIGWGTLEKVEVEISTTEMPALPQTAPAPTESLERLGLGLAFDRPFCVPHPKGNENTIYSREVIPGNVIKGALAASFDRCWGQGWRDQYLEKFDALRVSHAFPSSRNTPIRPLAPPYSLALDNEGKLHDINTDGAPSDDAMPLRFVTDWKAKPLGELRQRLDWPPLERELRVHNRIDPTPEDALYTVESMLPNDRLWLLNFNMPDGQDLNWLADLLEALDKAGEHPLYPIGRTKARAALVREKNGYRTHGAPSHLSTLKRKDEITVLLQTPARLLDLQEVRHAPSTGGKAKLHKRYAHTWQTMNKPDNAEDNGFELIDYQARQELFGGEFWWRHYHAGTTPYRPQLFTAAGSVFRLRVNDAGRANETLAKWLNHGVEYQDGDWPTGRKKYPWLTRHGYGEIIINPELPGGRLS